LLRWGTVVFDDLRRSVKEIEFLADPTAGEVRIASPEWLNMGFVPAVIDRLTREFPRLVFHVLQAPGVDLYKMLRERRADLAVSLLTGPFEQDDLAAEILYPDSLAVVAAPDSKWVRRRRVALAELVDEPWCLPTGDWVLRAVIARAFHEKGLPMPRHVVLSNSIQLFQAMAVTGRFLCFASKTRLRLTGKRAVLKAVPVDLHIPVGSVGIVTLKDRTISPAAQLFIDCARELAKPLAEP
jgi:DNA-binding transcriptional LysR family regulator